MQDDRLGKAQVLQEAGVNYLDTELGRQDLSPPVLSTSALVAVHGNLLHWDIQWRVGIAPRVFVEVGR